MRLHGRLPGSHPTWRPVITLLTKEKIRDIQKSSRHPTQSAGQPLQAVASSSVQVSQRIAAARAAESRRPRWGSSEHGDDEAALFIDPYAELLASWHVSKGAATSTTTTTTTNTNTNTNTSDLLDASSAHDIVATAHLDRLLLNATAIAAVNRISQGDYRQVVLVGDAMDTRPFRLPLPSGGVIYMVAPAEAHAAAEAAMASEAAAAIAHQLAGASAAAATGAAASAAATAAAGRDAEMATAASLDLNGGAGRSDSGAAASTSESAAVVEGRAKGGRSPVQTRRGPRPPPGCIIRRVPIDLKADSFSLLPSLEAAGFRAERLSVWVLQGLSGLGMSEQHVVSLLAEVALCAAYHSLVVGELPELSSAEAENALAECGLLGAPIAFGTPDTSYGRWRPEWGPPSDRQNPQRWLFASQQIRLSAAQMDTYSAHRAAAEDLDEDFFDNFS